jgi:nitrate reductase gamma subunit
MRLHFWGGIAAAHKATGTKAGKPADQHQLVSIVVGVLLAVLAVAGLVLLTATQFK